MISMTLQFIHQSAIGTGPSEVDRRIIRSHVMRGKNAGRPRQSTRKQKKSIIHVQRCSMISLDVLRPRESFNLNDSLSGMICV